ncbi:RES family NAD+ phosphorylase [Pseudomonas japonica]|uniref:RES family NAD+ phosphorylase n=1 Tax=Pseudomonas japonica TaxID=256466 RepID=UPI0015E40B4C|nr:RES family NAD+ phosphorylase [Pseudomonas japonica]MBA1291538.1 RES family NAD+ phosphorylase [Pseudomonas japonica]
MGADDIKTTLQLVQKLHSLGKLTKKIVKRGSLSYRVQSAGHENAEYYGSPEKPEQLGRYNDRKKEIGIWYGAQHPSGALAETFGGLRPADLKGIGIFLNATDLESRDMCVVEMSRDLKLLDLKLCLSKLARTVDEVSGPDYTLTQEIVGAVARLPGNPFDGIAYESRHHPDGHSCYALWTKPGEATTVKTIEMTKLSEFEYTGELPEGFEGDSMNAEEIMTEILGYKVLGS